MASLDILPQNWRERAVPVLDVNFTSLGEGVWIDDDCPLQPSVVVVTNGEIFRLDQKQSHLLLPALRYPGKLQIVSLLSTTVANASPKAPRLN